MSSKNYIEQSFEIDELADSILNSISVDSFKTEVSVITKSDLKQVTKKNKLYESVAGNLVAYACKVSF